MNRALILAMGITLGAGGTATVESFAAVTKADLYQPVSVDGVREVCLVATSTEVQTDAGVKTVAGWEVTAHICTQPDGVTDLAPLCVSHKGPAAPESIPAIAGLLKVHTLPALTRDHGLRLAQ